MSKGIDKLGVCSKSSASPTHCCVVNVCIPYKFRIQTNSQHQRQFFLNALLVQIEMGTMKFCAIPFLLLHVVRTLVNSFRFEILQNCSLLILYRIQNFTNLSTVHYSQLIHPASLTLPYTLCVAQVCRYFLCEFGIWFAVNSITPYVF